MWQYIAAHILKGTFKDICKMKFISYFEYNFVSIHNFEKKIRYLGDMNRINISDLDHVKCERILLVINIPKDTLVRIIFLFADSPV